HHARQPAARRVTVKSERVQILLAEHVVEMDAGAGHDDSGARSVAAGDRARETLAVERRDVGGVAEGTEEALRESWLVEPAQKLGGARGRRAPHRLAHGA